jgi:hypothetical protein
VVLNLERVFAHEIPFQLGDSSGDRKRSIAKRFTPPDDPFVRGYFDKQPAWRKGHRFDVDYLHSLTLPGRIS